MAWTLRLLAAGIKVFVFILVFQTSKCDIENCHLLNTPGITVPEGDIIIEHGDPLEIYCKLHDEYMKQHVNITSKDIVFNRNTESLPSDWVACVNDSTAKLYIEKPVPSQSMYTCKLKGIEHAVCLNTVIVGTKPNGVHNLSCIGYNYENLTCSWIEPEHYVKTTYNLTYYFQGRGSRSLYVCPNITRHGNKASCFWDVTTRPHYRQSQPTYYFFLNMSNKFGNYTQKLTLSHFANVIPGPPENLTVLNRTSDSVTLAWSVQRAMIYFPPSVIHRVVYQSEYDNKDEWHVANTDGITKSIHPTFNLTGLKYAHVLYDIRVSMISSKVPLPNEKMWSKNVSVTVRTLSALPGIPPKTNIGSFEIVNNKTKRDVYLYWQSIPEHLKNGENFSYKVIAVREDFTEKVIEPVEITNSYVKIVSISYMRHKFKIVSQNEMGHSVNGSEIIVPALQEQVKEPSSFTKISFGNQVYELSWIPPPESNNSPTESNLPVKNYTIFYCRNDYDRPFQCKGYLEWVVVPSNVTLINVTVPEDKIYQFAISANSENSSSGMVWASCTVIPDKGFTKMKSLWIDRIGSDFIEVGWKLDCSDRIGSIEGFTIYYCPIVSPVDVMCNGNEQNITITGDPIGSRGTITHLRPYTTYMLTVSVRSKHNNGLQSDALYNTTLEAAPDPPENVTIKNVTSTSMVVQWSCPKAMNGVLRYYEVKYSHNGKETSVKPEDEKSTIITLTNLNTYTEYNINVYAWTILRSNSSVTKTVKTAISVPGRMRSPNIKFQNETLIIVGWNPPDQAGGNLDAYELRIKEKIDSTNYTSFINTSNTQMVVKNCATDRTYKILYFSIRAINYDKKVNRRYVGEWSDETENYCRDSPRILYWLFIAGGICLLVLIACILKKVWHRCKIMRDVEVKLPPGLTPAVTSDLSLSHWPGTTLQKSPNDDPLMHIRTDSSADEELLLAKKTECGESLDRITSGDSSGCSSGHESVTSSLASGTNLSSTSDSGTEQPRTPSSESASRENSLRQRRTGSETLGWDSEIAWPNTKGYVLTMPLSDKSTLSSPSWNTNKTNPSNYCVLGVDTISPPTDIHGGYVPVPVSIPHSESPHAKNSPYITCDSIFNKQSDDETAPSLTKTAYVKSSDAALIGRPIVSVVPTQLQGGKPSMPSPTYVMAGNKNRFCVKPTGPDILPTGKLINIEPLHDVNVDSYMQHLTELDKTASAATTALDSLGSETVGTSPYVKADNILSVREPVTTIHEKHIDDRALVLTSDAPDDQQTPLNSYCRLGWDRAAATAGAEFSMPSPRTTVEPSKGYVPHRQFENKSLKED